MWAFSSGSRPSAVSAAIVIMLRWGSSRPGRLQTWPNRTSSLMRPRSGASSWVGLLAPLCGAPNTRRRSACPAARYSSSVAIAHLLPGTRSPLTGGTRPQPASGCDARAIGARACARRGPAGCAPDPHRAIAGTGRPPDGRSRGSRCRRPAGAGRRCRSTRRRAHGPSGSRRSRRCSSVDGGRWTTRDRSARSTRDPSHVTQPSGRPSVSIRSGGLPARRGASCERPTSGRGRRRWPIVREVREHALREELERAQDLGLGLTDVHVHDERVAAQRLVLADLLHARLGIADDAP